MIGGTEAHHLLHVLRLQNGSPLILFDGRGMEAEAVIESVTRRDVACRILSRRSHQPPAGLSVTIIASPPKADRLKWMVEKLTEIGVDRLILLNTRRTIVTPGESRVDKLKSSVVSACKQCRRPFLMELLPLQDFTSVVHQLGTESNGAAAFIAHPGADSDTVTSAAAQTTSLSLLVGPEGGFTDDEFRLAVQAGIRPISWPGNILRIETAAIVFGTLLISRRTSSHG